MSTDQTANLGLPFLMPAQAQKHVTVNESLTRLDAITQAAVESRSVSSQPGSPGDGQVWIAPAGKTGAEWGGYANWALAYYRDGAWEAIAPKTGWRVWVKDEARFLTYDGATWRGDLVVDMLNAGALAGLRNGFINGDFAIAQRGTSFAVASHNARIDTVDRWQARSGTSGACTVSLLDATPGDFEADGFEPSKILQFDQTTGASSQPAIAQAIEDVRSYAGQEIAVSFWARVTAGTLIVYPYRGLEFGSGGSSSLSGNIASSVTFTTAWQRFSATTTLPSITGKTIGVDSLLRIWLLFPSSTTFTAQIAGMQIEPGGVATPFERRPRALEEALCRRYYERWSADSGGDHIFAPAAGRNTSSAFANLACAPKRVVPTLGSSGSFRLLKGTSDVAVTSIGTFYNATEHGGLLLVNSSGLTADNAYHLAADGDATAFLEFDAELS